MISGLLRVSGLLAITTLGTSLLAQEQTDNRVSASTDWSVFQETDPVECFSVSAPRDSTATRDGAPVEANRSEIQLFVLFRPAASVAGQVAFTGGYPFASGSTVSMDVSGTVFEMFTEGEWAWPATPEDDAAIVAAMKRGSEAVLTGESGRGTVTRDTFSLSGFTAAVDEAQSRCAS